MHGSAWHQGQINQVRLGLRVGGSRDVDGPGWLVADETPG